MEAIKDIGDMEAVSGPDTTEEEFQECLSGEEAKPSAADGEEEPAGIGVKSLDDALRMKEAGNR